VKKLLPWFAVAALVIVADQLTKHMIQARFAFGESVPVTDFFSLVLAFNTGAAFSFLAGAGGWQRSFFIAVAAGAAALIVWMLRKHAHERWFCFGLALILGGALGNLWDRIVLGHVVDFLLFHYAGWYFPAFNVADSAITVGAVMLILDGMRGNAEKETSHVRRA
jgi:signal peptidase II